MVQVILKESKLAMYQYLIKFTVITTVLLGCFFQSTISSASVDASSSVASSSSETFALNDVHVERTLFYGMQGDDVRDLQQELRALPKIYPSGKVTGYFGSATKAAVRRFQQQEKINDRTLSKTTQSGVMDAHAWLMLHLRATEKKCPQNMSRSRQKCLEENYEHYAYRLGVDKTLSLLRLHISDEPQFAGACHSVMHHIAHSAVHEFKNFGNAMYHGTILCQNGYYHGVVEEYLRNENVDRLTADDLRNFCSTALEATSTATDILNCVHGVGHALMYMTRNDLPQSLLRCGDYIDDHLRSQCLTGAFMQEGFVASSSKKSETDEQIVKCTQTSGEQDMCWISLSAKVMSKRGTSIRAAQQFCDTLIDANYRSACTSAVSTTGS